MRPLYVVPLSTLAALGAFALVTPACSGGGSSGSGASTTTTTAGSSGAGGGGGSSESSASSSSTGAAGGGEAAGGATGSDGGAAGEASGAGATGGAGSGGDGGGATAQAAEPPAPDVAMHVQSVSNAAGWFRGIDIERRDDGSLLFRGQPVGRMTGGHIISVDGQPVPLTGRLSIGVRGRREHMEIQPDGSIRMDGGVLTIGPSGDVLIARRAGGPTQPVHVQITGFTPAAIRTADILLAYGIMRADLASR